MITAIALPKFALLQGAELSARDREAVIAVPENGDATLIEIHDGQGATAYDTFKITVGANAKLTHYKIVAEGPHADHHSFLEAQVERSGSFQSHVFLLGGKRVRNTIRVRLAGEAAECSLSGLYLATDEEIVETHTLIEHLQTRGTSREFYKGILDKKAQGLFDGLIVVGAGAQKTDSAQTNKNLLLSSQARAKSNPELKILANDVKCKHGSTIGQIDPNQLFYLRARGILQEDAKRLLVYAFASEMIAPIGIPALRETLELLLLNKFQA